MKHLLTITDKDITGSEKLSAAEPRIAVNAVLFDIDGNIALSYMGKYDLHTLPGGGVDPGEDLHAAVKREIWEETGCDCVINGELGQTIENRSEHDFTQERYYYLARVVGDKGELHLTDEEINENTTAVWHPLEQALKIISEKQHDNYQRKFIQKRDIAVLTEALTWLHTHDVPGYSDFVRIEPLIKGWSSDKKYVCAKDDGSRFLLRIADISEHDRKKSEYESMQKIAALGVPMQQPVDFGVCNDGKNVYILLTWVDGEDAKDILPTMTETEQYTLGLKAGKILRKLHSIESYQESSEWAKIYGNKIESYIKNYKNCGMTFDGDLLLLDYIEQNRYLLEYRPMCFAHGDFHVGNLIVSTEKELYLIDFQRCRIEDPYYEIKSIMFSADVSPHFATGQLNGYFDGEPPEDFWNLLTFYLAAVSINALPWSIPFGQDEIDFAYKMNKSILHWFDNMKKTIPTWYLKDFYIQWTDGVPYKLKAPFDFSFLSKYGKVFKVYDDQDSGNICFGVADGDNKYFVKFAGAPTERSRISTEEAVSRIKNTVPIYRDLAHPILTRLINAEEIGGVPPTGIGYAMVFEWTDAECMGRQYPASREKFMQMPLDTRLRVFDEILAFHAHVAKNGYVAIDFYDGCIMYDFNIGRTTLCDIEFYAKTPYNNPIGRMWGSSRFMSPEEFELGAVIDEITNVYTMGATAFALFGNEWDRCVEQWVLSKELFDVAKKAVSDERNERQQSIEQFIAEWRAAK